MLWTEKLVTSMSVVITSAGPSLGKCESKVAIQCSKEVKDIAMSSFRVAEDNSETSAMSRQNDHSLDEDPLEEIRLAWVDDPVPIHFIKHKSLIRYARDLKMISDVMRDYSKSHDCVEKAVLDATLEYGKKAHDVYCNSLHQWLHDNPDSLARDKVESLVRVYPEKERHDLERYYLRATNDPENRTKSTLLSSASKLSKASKDSRSIIEDQRQEIFS